VARTARPMPRRNYATVHAAQTGGDMPWIIGSVAFTVPAVVYLMSGNDHTVVHDKHSVGKKVESAKQTLADAASKAPEKASELTQSAKEKAAEATSKAPKDTASETAEEVKDKARETGERAKESASGATEEARQTVSETTEKVKGKASELTTKAKEATSDLGEKAKATKENVKDKVSSDNPEASRVEGNKEQYTEVSHTGQGYDATSREAGSSNTQSGKQEGLSNSDTFHSGLASGQGKDISKKAEGVHDSSKLKGTVDPARRGS